MIAEIDGATADRYPLLYFSMLAFLFAPYTGYTNEWGGEFSFWYGWT